MKSSCRLSPRCCRWVKKRRVDRTKMKRENRIKKRCWLGCGSHILLFSFCYLACHVNETGHPNCLGTFFWTVLHRWGVHIFWTVLHSWGVHISGITVRGSHRLVVQLRDVRWTYSFCSWGRLFSKEQKRTGSKVDLFLSCSYEFSCFQLTSPKF